MATYNEYASTTQGPVAPRQGGDELFNTVGKFEESQSQKQTPLKAPTNRAEIKELLDPNNTGEVTTERAKEAADALQQGVSGSNFLVRNAVKRELSNAAPEEAKENIEKRLGLKLESLETAKVIQNAVLKGANQEQLVARESGKDYIATTRENPKLSHVAVQDILAKQLRAMDENHNLEVHKDEATKAFPDIKNAVSKLPSGIKNQLLEGSVKAQEYDHDGKKTAEKLSEIAGISVTKEAVMEIRSATIAGAKSPNPNAEIAKKEEEEKEKSAIGKKKEKNFFEALLELIKPILVALGFMEKEEPKKDTEVAKDPTPKPEEKSAKGDGKGQEQQPQLTPEEKKKSLEYFASLDETIQKDIRRAGAQANGVGTVYAGKESDLSPQVQTVSANQPSASASASL